MPNEITTQSAVQTNPFAKHAPEHVNAGTIAIESERAIAEAQGKLIIAKRFPRSQSVAYANIIDACKRTGLAEEAVYSFPRGGQTVSGPSIRLAEMLAANWGNIDYGIRELSRKEGVSEMEAYAWDLETNTISSQKFTVRHIRDTKGGGVALRDERDIYELTANMGGRRLRARILAIMPADLIQAAVDECSKTLAGGNDLPIPDRIRNAVTAFKAFGVQPALIEKRLGHPLDSMTGEELADLRKIHNSIRDGVSKVSDWFGDGPKSDDDGDGIEGDPTPARPEPPARKKRGAAAVSETPAATEPTATPTVPPSEPAKQTAAEVAKPLQTATEANAAAKADEPAKTETTKPAPRAFLKDGENIVAEVEVVSAEGVNISQNGKPTPSVKATVKGEYNNVVRMVAAGIAGEGGAVTPAKPWVPGARLRLELQGKLSAAKEGQPNFGQVLGWVKKCEVMAPVATEEGEG